MTNSDLSMNIYNYNYYFMLDAITHSRQNSEAG